MVLGKFSQSFFIIIFNTARENHIYIFGDSNANSIIKRYLKANCILNFKKISVGKNMLLNLPKSNDTMETRHNTSYIY